MTTTFELPRLRCARCAHEWSPRAPHPPKVCPVCKSYDWQTPRKQRAEGRTETPEEVRAS